jgi:hypothetical protein
MKIAHYFYIELELHITKEIIQEVVQCKGMFFVVVGRASSLNDHLKVGNGRVLLTTLLLSINTGMMSSGTPWGSIDVVIRDY